MRLPRLLHLPRVAWLAAGIVLLGVVVLVRPDGVFAQPPGPQVPSVLAPDAPAAEQIAQLFTFVLWLAVGIFVLVEGLIIYSVVKFRAKPSDGSPVQIYGNVQLEVAWTVIPALLVLTILILSLQVMPSLYNVPGETAASASADIGVCYTSNLSSDQVEQIAGNDLIVVNVIGRQWWWEFQYPQYGFSTATQLVVPATKVVKMVMGSADVIHAWWIPELGPQYNVTPGYDEVRWFQAARPRTYEGQCSMFCGDSHPYMPMQVVAISPADFDRWANEQRQPAEPPANALIQRGEQLFLTKGCVGCHAINGYPENKAQGDRGPNLTHFGSRGKVASYLDNTPENLAHWLRNGNDIKPGNLMSRVVRPGFLKEDEIAALVSYLENLK
jgi:cytochrome c oxidase subunit 2